MRLSPGPANRRDPIGATGIGRVVNGDYGVAIAYSAVLIALMVAAIVVIQRLVGVRVVTARAAQGAS